MERDYRSEDYLSLSNLFMRSVKQLKRNNYLKKGLTIFLIITIAMWVNTSLGVKVQAMSIPHAMPINQIFPDYNLANVVKRHLGKQSVTDVVAQRELDKVQILNGNGCNISSMEGVQYFRHLKQLSMSYNQISDVKVLTSLRQLELLILEHNKLENIDILVDIPTLEGLYVGNNALRDLWALEAMGNLKYIDAAEQKCINKPVEYQPNLVITNTIKDMIGKPIIPNFISDNGTYINTDVTWDLPNPNFITEVSYSFEEVQNIGKEQVLFSGVVIQPIKPQSPAIENTGNINRVLPESSFVEVLKKSLRKNNGMNVGPQNELDKAIEFHDENRGNVMFIQLKKSLFM